MYTLEKMQYKILSIIKNFKNKNQTTTKELATKDLYLKELLYANVFHDSINNVDWIKDKNFTLINGAANYSFITVLFKILDDTNPQNILEFGLGQTSKLTTQYIKYKNPNSHLAIIDHDQNWIDFFQNKLALTENSNIYYKKLIKFRLNNILSDKYDCLNNITNNQRYDFIIIDGPYGFDRKYPRTNILDLIPNNLAKDFIIILDDAERLGEKNTAKLLFEALDNNNIKYIYSYKQAMKTQLVISTTKYQFIHWY